MAAGLLVWLWVEASVTTLGAVHARARSPLMALGPDSFGATPKAASGLLFQDSKAALARAAIAQQELLDPNTRQIGLPKRKRPTVMKKRGGGGKKKAITGGGGFGAGAQGLSVQQQENLLRKETLLEDGVCLVENVLSREDAETLRVCVADELAKAYAAVERNVSQSLGRFNVPHETHDPLRGYLLLPLRDEQSVAEGVNQGPMVRSLDKLLQDGAMLGDLFSSVCGGDQSEWYDLVALRTEAGAARQIIHSDTPFQKVPGLYCAFIALQDVRYSMGTTVFIPGTHLNTAQRRDIMEGQYDNRRDEALAKAQSRYALLKAGDAVCFDMRTLHAGTANFPLEEGGGQRLLLALTFRNRAAKQELGHAPNLRPAYRNRGISLGEMRSEFAKEAPFAGLASDGKPFGDGLH